jgi:hypothetical protein
MTPTLAAGELAVPGWAWGDDPGDVSGELAGPGGPAC